MLDETNKIAFNHLTGNWVGVYDKSRKTYNKLFRKFKTKVLE